MKTVKASAQKKVQVPTGLDLDARFYSAPKDEEFVESSGRTLVGYLTLAGEWGGGGTWGPGGWDGEGGLAWGLGSVEKCLLGNARSG
jgi:hypothetical protein